MALNSWIENLWLEGDSLKIIKYIQGITKPSWTIANIIEEIIADLHRFKKFHVSHVYREANMVADWFANEVVACNSMMTWENNNHFPVVAIELIRKEKIHGTNIISFL